MAAIWDLVDDYSVTMYTAQYPCLVPHLDSILNSFSSIEIASLHPESPSTSQIRSRVDERLDINFWNRRILVTEDFPAGVSQANYEVDYQRRFNCDSCNVIHQISIELGFDNRQAIGSNLLKLDIANRSFHDRHESASIGIIVVTNAGGRQEGRWDGSVAVDYEYSWARRKAYAGYLSTAILLLTLS